MQLPKLKQRTWHQTTIVDEDHRHVAYGVTPETSAEIIRRCNAFDELVEALSRLLPRHDQTGPVAIPEPTPKDVTFAMDVYLRARAEPVPA